MTAPSTPEIATLSAQTTPCPSVSAPLDDRSSASISNVRPGEAIVLFALRVPELQEDRAPYPVHVCEPVVLRASMDASRSLVDTLVDAHTTHPLPAPARTLIKNLLNVAPQLREIALRVGAAPVTVPSETQWHRDLLIGRPCATPAPTFSTPPPVPELIAKPGAAKLVLTMDGSAVAAKREPSTSQHVHEPPPTPSLVLDATSQRTSSPPTAPVQFSPTTAAHAATLTAPGTASRVITLEATPEPTMDNENDLSVQHARVSTSARAEPAADSHVVTQSDSLRLPEPAPTIARPTTDSENAVAQEEETSHLPIEHLPPVLVPTLNDDCSLMQLEPGQLVYDVMCESGVVIAGLRFDFEPADPLDSIPFYERPRQFRVAFVLINSPKEASALVPFLRQLDLNLTDVLDTKCLPRIPGHRSLSYAFLTVPHEFSMRPHKLDRLNIDGKQMRVFRLEDPKALFMNRSWLNAEIQKMAGQK
ncbi:hypothetical protein GGF32_004439 [Allomyces javanicus]|nr:hypothetical protein GGF32_004439 [Allomyces javanicus]